MAPLVHDLNQLPTTTPSHMSIEPASPEVDWPGLDELSLDEDGFLEIENPAVGENTDIPDLNHVPRPERKRELTSDERLGVLKSLLQRSQNGKLKRGATMDVAVQFGVRVRTVQRIWKRARDSGTNAARGALPSAIRCSPAIVANAVAYMSTSDERLEVLKSLLQRSQNGKLKRGATMDVAVQFGVRVRTVQRIWKRARDSGTNAARGALPSAIRCSPAIVANAVAYMSS